MRNYLLYQAYGSKDHINECRYSLLKYLSVYNLQPPPATAIVIYTDAPALFEAFTPFFHTFEMMPVDAPQIQQWRGAIDFVHRVKIEILRDFFQLFEGHVLYCDTDTYILKPLEPLFNELKKGSFYMHDYEGLLDDPANPYFHKWNTFLRSAALEYNKKQFTYSGGLKIWNAGVVGISSHKRDKVEDVLALTDVIYPRFKKHIAEQFAFSYCLQNAGTVHSSADSIAHYWNLKELRKLLQHFFRKNEEESIPNLVKLINHIDAAEMQAHKNRYTALPFYKKWMQVLTGKSWSIEQYKNKL